MEEVYNVAQVCEILGLTRKTVSDMLLKGTLPGAKVGHQWRVLESELKAVLRGPHTHQGGGRHDGNGHGNDH
jgi:excisionase family DNA binding protein